MSKKILICVNPNHKELMEYIISWCSDNLKLESSNIQLVFAHCLDSDLDFSTISKFNYFILFEFNGGFINSWA